MDDINEIVEHSYDAATEKVFLALLRVSGEASAGVPEHDRFVNVMMASLRLAAHVMAEGRGSVEQFMLAAKESFEQVEDFNRRAQADEAATESEK